MNNKKHQSKWLRVCGVVGVVTIFGLLYRRSKRLDEVDPQRTDKDNIHKTITKIKTKSFFHYYSWMRYYLPLLLNNVTIIALLKLYKNSNYYNPNSQNKVAWNPIKITPLGRAYYPTTNNPKPSKLTEMRLHIGPFSCTLSQFFFNDFLFLTASMNVLFCIFLDQIFNYDPCHPLMLFENNVEYKFISSYKMSVNNVINEYIDNSFNNKWLLDIIWSYITYPTKKSHMIIDVKFKNKKLKYQSFICRKYKSILSSQFSMYQKDMKYLYQMDNDFATIQPNFEYFWKIRTFGMDFNALCRSHPRSFKLRDTQQLIQFTLWYFVNFGFVYIFDKFGFDEKDNGLLWRYKQIIMVRESVSYAVLTGITSAKWLYGGFFILILIPKYYQQYVKTKKSKSIKKHVHSEKRKHDSPNKNTSQRVKEKQDLEWFWHKS